MTGDCDYNEEMIADELQTAAPGTLHVFNNKKVLHCTLC